MLVSMLFAQCFCDLPAVVSFRTCTVLPDAASPGLAPFKAQRTVTDRYSNFHGCARSTPHAHVGSAYVAETAGVERQINGVTRLPLDQSLLGFRGFKA